MGPIHILIIAIAAYVLGETQLVSDVYRAMRGRIRARRAARKPRTAVSLARAIHEAHWRRLEIPTITRIRGHK